MSGGRPNGPNVRQSGFTLLELLIAVVLLALITTMLLAGLQLETQNLPRQTGRLDRAGQLPPVYDFLRSELADAQPVVPIGATSRSIVFDGEPDAVHFVSTGPQSVQIGGLQLLSVTFARGALRVRWRLFDGALPDDDQPGRDVLLLDHLARVQLSFFGVVPPDTEPHWYDTWHDMPYLPSLVRFSMTSADGVAIPELTVATRLSAAPAPPPGTAGTSP